MSRIRTLRMMRGLKQRDVAELMDVSIQSISAWENGTREMSASQLQRMAEILNCSMEALMPPTSNVNISKLNRIMIYLENAPQDIIDGLDYIISDWTGDSVALGRFALLYASLSPLDREDIACNGLVHFANAKASGRITQQEIEVCEEYLESKWRRLLR